SAVVAFGVGVGVLLDAQREGDEAVFNVGQRAGDVDLDVAAHLVVLHRHILGDQRLFVAGLGDAVPGGGLLAPVGAGGPHAEVALGAAVLAGGEVEAQGETGEVLPAALHIGQVEFHDAVALIVLVVGDVLHHQGALAGKVFVGGGG